MKKVINWPSIPTGILLICLVVFFSSVACAENLSFSWTANPEPLTGYKLYYKTGTDSEPPYNGTGLPQGSSPIIIGKTTEFIVTGRDITETYHFVLTAYNDQGESSYTSVVTVDPLDGGSAPPDMTAPTINLIRLN